MKNVYFLLINVMNDIVKSVGNLWSDCNGYCTTGNLYYALQMILYRLWLKASNSERLGEQHQQNSIWNNLLHHYNRGQDDIVHIPRKSHHPITQPFSYMWYKIIFNFLFEITDIWRYTSININIFFCAFYRAVACVSHRIPVTMIVVAPASYR